MANPFNFLIANLIIIVKPRNGRRPEDKALNFNARGLLGPGGSKPVWQQSLAHSRGSEVTLIRWC